MCSLFSKNHFHLFLRKKNICPLSRLKSLGEGEPLINFLRHEMAVAIDPRLHAPFQKSYGVTERKGKNRWEN